MECRAVEASVLALSFDSVPCEVELRGNKTKAESSVMAMRATKSTWKAEPTLRSLRKHPRRDGAGA